MSVRSTATPISPLRRRMIEDMTIRNLSPTTQRSYLHAVEGYSRYFGRSPDRLDFEDARAYQVHLAGKGIAWATLNQIVCALRFLCSMTLGQDEVPERIPFARKRATLPEVLSRDEVVRIPGVGRRQCDTALQARHGFEKAHHLVTPTSSSWPNQVEQFFALITERKIRRGVYRSIVELRADIEAFISQHNADPKPFRWTKSADQTLR